MQNILYEIKKLFLIEGKNNTSKEERNKKERMNCRRKFPVPQSQVNTLPFILTTYK